MKRKWGGDEMEDFLIATILACLSTKAFRP